MCRQKKLNEIIQNENTILVACVSRRTDIVVVVVVILVSFFFFLLFLLLFFFSSFFSFFSFSFIFSSLFIFSLEYCIGQKSLSNESSDNADNDKCRGIECLPLSRPYLAKYRHFRTSRRSCKKKKS